MRCAPSKRVAFGASFVFPLLLAAPVLAQTTPKTPKTAGTSGTTAPAGQQPAQDEASATSTTAEDEKKKDEEKELKEATRAVFVSGDVAFNRVDLGGISDNTGFDQTAANGLLYGLAAGLRLKGFRFGARWRVFDTTEYTLWSAAGSIGYGLPLRPLQPIFSVFAGYAWDQKINQGAFRSSLPPGTVLPPNVNVNGFLLGFDVNAAYWMTKFIRLGAFIGTDIMFLNRSQASLPPSIFPISDEFRAKPLYSDSGSGIAYTIEIGLRGAFDVGF